MDADKRQAILKIFEEVHHGVLTAFLLAAIPVAVFDLAGLIAGATGVSLWRYLLGTLLGKITQAMVLAFAGFYSASWFINL